MNKYICISRCLVFTATFFISGVCFSVYEMSFEGDFESSGKGNTGASACSPGLVRLPQTTSLNGKVVLANKPGQKPVGWDYKTATPVIPEPRHPAGNVEKLKINGKAVLLEGKQIKDGIIRTRDFGNIEILVVGWNTIVACATDEQIKKISHWAR